MALIDVHVDLKVPAHEKAVDLPCIHFLPGLGIHIFEESGSSVITNDSLAHSDGIVCRLVEGVGVSLSTGVAGGVVLLESSGTDCGFLTD